MTALPHDTEADLRRRILELEQRLQSTVAQRDEAIERQTAAALVNFRLQNELRATVDRQKAGAEILRTIAAAPTDAEQSLQPLLKLQNPAPEIGFRVMGKRGHSGQIQVARRTPSVPGSNVHKPFWAHDYSIPAAVRPAPEALFSDRGVNAVGA